MERGKGGKGGGEGATHTCNVRGPDDTVYTRASEHTSFQPTWAQLASVLTAHKTSDLPQTNQLPGPAFHCISHALTILTLGEPHKEQYTSTVCQRVASRIS